MRRFGGGGAVLYPDCGGGHTNLVHVLKFIEMYTPPKSQKYINSKKAIYKNVTGKRAQAIEVFFKLEL